MKNKPFAYAAGGFAIAAFFGCQIIAGLEDRSEAPSAAAGTSGAGGGWSGGVHGQGAKGGSAANSGSGGQAGGTDAGSDAASSCDIPDSAPFSIPPPRLHDGGKGSGADAVTFAIRKFHVGAVNTMGLADMSAWREYGYDIDRLCTVDPDGGKADGSCLPLTANPNDLEDGIGCIDNNFGKFIASLPSNGGVTLETNANMRVENGEVTLALVIDDLDPGPCDDYAPGYVYMLVPYDVGIDAGPPKWVGNDERVVDPRSLADAGPGADGGPGPARVAFPNGYVRGNVWVSGDVSPQITDFFVPLGDYTLDIQISHLVITTQLDPTHRTASGTMLSGVLDPANVSAQLQIAVQAQLGCLDIPAVDQAIASVMLLADLSSGPKIQDPSVPCDEISVGLGFDLAPILPLKKTYPFPVQNPCDAGLAGSGGSGGKGGTAGNDGG